MPDTWRLGVGDERARVAIVGCGGAGCNVLRRVAALPNATRIAMNDTVHPSMAEVSTRVLVASDSLQAFATVPFTVEGPIRRQLAEAQLRLLQKRADGVVTFSNDQLLQIAKDLPLTKAFAALGAIMARPASELGAVLSRSDVVPLRRTFARVREWRFGMGAAREKHRCFVAVEEAYASPWFN